MNGKAIIRTAMLMLLSAAVAFLAGMIVAGGGTTADGPDLRLNSTAELRDPWSPALKRDPGYLAQQRRNVESMQQFCRETGKNCREAEEARRWLEFQGASE